MPKRAREDGTEAMSAIEPEAGPSTSPVPNGEATLKVPQKRFYRQRAHANVFVDHLLD